MDPENDNGAHLGARLARLTTALEAQANATNRLVQLMMEEQLRKRGAKRGRARRPILESERAKKVVITPMVEAQVRRALARVGR